MNTIENLKSGYYKVFDNQGVSVTKHFTQCLEKEFANLEVKIAEKEKEMSFAEIQKLIFGLSEQKELLLSLLKENAKQMKYALALSIKIKVSSGDWKL